MTETTAATEPITGDAGRLSPGELLLEVTDLVKHFPVRGGLLHRTRDVVHAVCGVSLGIDKGETLGVVGESGCGKSTTCLLYTSPSPRDS